MVGSRDRTIGLLSALISLIGALVVIDGCGHAPPPRPYLEFPVARRDIIVSSQASGAIEPDTVIEVKSKAAGEVLDVLATTGQLVRRGDLLIRIDPRQPRNQVAQAQADLDAAQSTLSTAAAAKDREDTLFAARVVTKAEHDQVVTDWARAKADVVKAQVALENAQIQLEDADIRAPATGRIIEQDVERGQIVASATTNVGGGAVLLKMADLSLMQVRTLVDETDIGKIRPGLRATITVDAFPNRPFEGTVLKIEPTPQVQQNVTMFPVLVRIPNENDVLEPGMNCEVEIHVGRRDSVLAVPYAALRTPKDAGSAAQLLGLSPTVVQQAMAPRTDTSGVTLRVRRAVQSTPSAAVGGEFIVFVLRQGQPAAVRITTGMTDLDWAEVTSGVTTSDTILLLPSASLTQSQQALQQRVQRLTGGGLPGVRQQQPQTNARP
jgi:HlyD family secretion protein